MKKIFLLSLLFIPTILITGCKNEEKMIIEQTVVDFKPVEKYSEARAIEYIVEEKTAEEIASEVFKEQMGILNNKETSFEISGNLDENLFVKSAVSDGRNLPTIAGFTEEQISNINSNGGLDVWAEDNETDYNELIENRDSVVEILEGNSEKILTDSISKAIEHQEKLKGNDD